jgi:Kef-type K+ transport system membrane component KefB
VVEVDAASFLVIVAVASLAGVTAALLERRIAIPVVVIELLLGIVVGPDLLEIAEPDSFTDFFANPASGCCSSSPATRSTSGESRDSR